MTEAKAQPKTIVLDATKRPLGRLASEIAVLLQGKRLVGYRPNRTDGPVVVIQHAEKIALTGKKSTQMVYRRASGYRGGLKTIPFRITFAKSPERVIKLAVWNMLPKNRLRDQRMKRLRFERS